MMTLASYGNFSIWHKDADLWIKDMVTSESRAVQELCSDCTESYHSWSSSGRWVVFSSRRGDNTYTRLYLAHFNPDGTFSKPFLLPQRSPDFYSRLFKSYNIPEFTVDRVKQSPRKFDISQNES